MHDRGRRGGVLLACLLSLGAIGKPPAPRMASPRAAFPSAAPRSTRAIGQGQPVIVLHGGPDFDHGYCCPTWIELQDPSGSSTTTSAGAENPRKRSAEDVTLASDIEDLDQVRRHFRLDAPVLLGHSWGAVLALEYALRHPTHVSRLVLMNPAPASASDVAVLRKVYREARRRHGSAAGDRRQRGLPGGRSAKRLRRDTASISRPRSNDPRTTRSRWRR